MNILAIDTVTSALGLCLKTEDSLLRITFNNNFKHAETLAPWIKNLCSEAGISPKNLNLIIVSKGPGSFTGIRIGMATAKGLVLGSGCHVKGVPTLDAMAWGKRYFNGLIIPVIDAKKKRVYSAFYKNNKKITEDLDISPVDLIEKVKDIKPKENILITGPYAQKLYETIENKENIYLDSDHSLINPYSLLEKGLEIYKNTGSDGDDLEPVYIRKSEAEIARGRKQIETKTS